MDQCELPPRARAWGCVPRALTKHPLTRPPQDENPLLRAAATAARHNFATPLDEVDAAARILDPVFAPLLDAEAGRPCRPVYGAFLKDYHSIEW